MAPQSGTGGVLSASSGVLCYNCSDLQIIPLTESLVSSQPTALQVPGNSQTVATPSWALYDEEDSRVWRGKVRSRWESLGFDSAVFELFTRMKGAKTRLSILDALSVPKDRMRLARELRVDWRAVDYHIYRLNRCGLVQEDRAFGNVKLYGLTTSGETLLRLLREFERDGNAAPIEAASVL
jgi:DNA-binding transcriptional ArsR family regulator